MKHWLCIFIIAVFLKGAQGPILTSLVQIRPEENVVLFEVDGNHIAELPFVIIDKIDFDYHPDTPRRWIDPTRPYYGKTIIPPDPVPGGKSF